MFSLIVPAYNEGKKIYGNLGVIEKTLLEIIPDGDFEIIPVNDGSKDNTAEEIMRAGREIPHIRPVSYDVNRGKGGALIEGVAHTSGDIVAFLDADLDISPDHFRTYLPAYKEQNADVVIGSKMHKDSNLEYPLARKVFSVGYFVLLKILFGLGLKDTQTGIKVYKGNLIREIAPKLTVKGYAFDIEILAMALMKGAKVIEMPVAIVYSRESSTARIRIKDIFRMFTDTVGIWWRIRVKKNY